MTEKNGKELWPILLNFGNIYETGSRYTCNPPSQTSDWDYLLHCDKNKKADVEFFLAKEGFVAEGCEQYPYQDKYGFVSYRKELVNFIVTTDDEFAELHCLATKVCKKLNLLKKEDRVTVFQAILYNNFDGELAW